MAKASPSLVAQWIAEANGKIHWKSLDPDASLHVRIDANGQATFYFRSKKYKMVRRIGPASLCDIGEAKAKCYEIKQRLIAGHPVPRAQGHSEVWDFKDNLVLGELLKQWRAAVVTGPRPRWKLDDRRAEIKFKSIVSKHLSPFDNQQIQRLNITQLVEHLTQLFDIHASHAKSLRSWIRDALVWAELEGMCANGCKSANMLDMGVKSRHWHQYGRSIHQASLPVLDAPEFFFELRQVPGTAAKCLQFCILTASRPSSAIHLRWKDLDLKQRIWRCPSEYMKEKEHGMHKVYLSDQAINIINMMPRTLPNGQKAEWVFSTIRGDHLCSDLCKVIHDMNIRRKRLNLRPWVDPLQEEISEKERQVTAHGFRATFKTWTRSEKLGNWGKYDDKAVERCLHHYDRKDPYDREVFEMQQRDLLQQWADYLHSYKVNNGNPMTI